MKKRIVLTVFVAMVLICVLAVSVSARTVTASGDCGDNLTWTLYEDGELVIEGAGDMWEYKTKYDSTFDKYITTAPWGKYANKLKKLTLTEGVTTIGDRAFFNCIGFTGNLVIPDSVTTIGGRAFEDCSGFTGNLIIPDSVTSIGYWAFLGCSKFTGDLVIPDSVMTIGQMAFSDCGGFTGTLTIGNGVTTISTCAFSSCRGFTEIHINPGVLTTINDSAFANCTSLKSITIPASVVSIGSGVFERCTNFTIYGCPDSYAQMYAKSKGFKFVEKHEYDTNCDEICNSCEYIRSVRHSYSWVIDKESTCGVDGIKHEECTNCHITRNENTVINATGIHSYNNVCDEICNVCEQTRTAPHNYKWVIDKENTCGVDGIKHEECTNCHITRNENTVISATGIHSYDNVCDGVCNVCEQTRTVPHNYKWVIDKENTCSVDGIKHEECANCHVTRNENTVISATGNHSFSSADDMECNICEQIAIFVELDSNGGSSISSIKVIPNQPTGLLSKSPTRSGYNFVGWATTKSGEPLYKSGDILIFGEITKLYAQWNKLCDVCSGSGKLKCSKCAGTGVVGVYKTCTACSGGAFRCGGCGSWQYRTAREIIKYNTLKVDSNDATGYYCFTRIFCRYCSNKLVYTSTQYVYPDDTNTDIKNRFLNNIFTSCGLCFGEGKNLYNATCPDCINAGKVDCLTCKGKGEVIRINVSAPGTPTVESESGNIITLKNIQYGEYSMDGMTWQSSPVFGNLEHGEKYTFYQRYAKTDTRYASDSSPALIVTFCGHVETTTVEENRVEPTYTAVGGYDSVVYCLVCNAEISRSHKNLNKIKLKASGQCGDNLTWSLYENGDLIIEGTGDMWDYDNWGPWEQYNVGNKLILPVGITSIGKNAFHSCGKFTGELVIPNSVTSIGDFAFSGCSGLTKATIFATEATFGASVFENTSADFEIHGYAGSTAEAYAKENNHMFVALKEGIAVNDSSAPSVSYTVSEQLVTITDEVVCKVGYLLNGKYVTVEAKSNGNGGYDFEAPDNVSEVVIVVAGDVSGDGEVDTDDKDVFEDLIFKTDELTAEQFLAADVNRDGVVDTADLVLIAKSQLDESHKFHKELEW